MKSIKNTLVLILVSVLILSCKKSNEEPSDSLRYFDNYPYDYLRDYTSEIYPNIEYKEHYLSYSYDTAYIGVFGEIDKKLWFGVFENSKSKIENGDYNLLFEYLDSDTLKNFWEWDLGYGEIDQLKLENTNIPRFAYSNNYLFMDVRLYNGDYDFYGNQIVYYITPDFVKKDNRCPSPDSKSDLLCGHGDIKMDILLNWYKGYTLTGELDSLGKDVETGSLYCYSSSGEKLNSISLTRSELIKTFSEPCLKDDIHPCSITDFVEGCSSRINANSGNTVWENSGAVFDDIPSNARLDKEIVMSDEEDFFYYSRYYTLLDGSKEKKEFKLNIANGNIVYL